MILLLYFISISVLLVLSGFFSGSETALFSLKTWQIRQLEIKKSDRAKLISKLVTKPRNLLITILVGNMMVNVTTSTVTESLCHRILGDSSILIAVTSATVFLLMFGEILPKVIAIHFPRRFALFVALPLTLFQKLISPLSKILYSITVFFMGIIKHKISSEEPGASREEVQEILDMGRQEGVVHPSEQILVTSIFDFAKTRIRDITVPLDKVFSINMDMTPDKIISLAVEKGFARVPVYDKTPENIIGILLLKDLLPYLIGMKTPESITPLIIYPVKVRRNQRALNVLSILRRKKIHMALVVDRNNKVVGIITIEDILKNLNLEIAPEYRNQMLYLSGEGE